MARIAAFFALIALAIGSIAAASELAGEQAGEPPSSKPPSTGVAASSATPETATAIMTAAPPATPARVTASLAPASERTDVTDAIPTPPARSEAVIEEAAEPIAYDAADQAPGWQQRKGQAALERIAYDWERIGFRIKFMGPRAGYRGGTFPYEKLIEIYVRPELSVDEIAWDIAHELGHAYDWVFNTDAERALFKRVRGYGDNPAWFACSGCTDFSTPAGDFAETFAFWAMDAENPHRGRITAPPTEQQLALLEPLFT